MIKDRELLYEKMEEFCSTSVAEQLSSVTRTADVVLGVSIKNSQDIQSIRENLKQMKNSEANLESGYAATIEVLKELDKRTFVMYDAILELKTVVEMLSGSIINQSAQLERISKMLDYDMN